MSLWDRCCNILTRHSQCPPLPRSWFLGYVKCFVPLKSIGLEKCFQAKGVLVDDGVQSSEQSEEKAIARIDKYRQNVFKTVNSGSAITDKEV